MKMMKMNKHTTEEDNEERVLKFAAERNAGKKLYVVINMSVEQPTGKLARNAAHGVTKVIMHHFLSLKWRSLMKWYKGGMATIILQSKDINAHILDDSIKCIDAGLTVYGKPTMVAVTYPIGKHPMNLMRLKLL